MTTGSIAVRFIGLATLLAFALPAAAQSAGSGSVSGSGSLSSGSGTVMSVEDRISVLQQLLEKRTVRTREDLLEKEDRLAQFMKDKIAYEKELAILREKCRSDIRKSNRDTKLRVTLMCYRSDLTLQMAFLRKENAYLKQLTGLSETAKAKALGMHANLSDAMATIVLAIDSGVYEDPLQLESAKKKLWQQYQNPRYVGLSLLRADRALGWIGLLAQRLRVQWQLEGLSDDVRDKITQSVNCLEKSASIAKSVGSLTNYESTKVLFGQYQSELGKCAEMLRATVRSAKGISDPSVEGGSGAVQAGSGTVNTTK
jgi:hypothetical protein